MDATELFQAGKLDEAVAAQTAQVKANPGDQAKRLFLFELLAFAGEYERAKRQLDALKYDEIELETAAADYRKLLEAEEYRRKVFREGLQPKFVDRRSARACPTAAHEGLQRLRHQERRSKQRSRWLKPPRPARL